jgi:hypothetical protein
VSRIGLFVRYCSIPVRIAAYNGDAPRLVDDDGGRALKGLIALRRCLALLSWSPHSVGRRHD